MRRSRRSRKPPIGRPDRTGRSPDPRPSVLRILGILHGLDPSIGCSFDFLTAGDIGAGAGPARTVFGGGVAALLRADRAAGAAGGGQCLRRQNGAGPQSAARRSDFPPLLRRARPEAGADAALARFGRDGRSVRSGRDQQPRHRGRRSGQGLALGQARVRGRDRAQGLPERSGRAAPERCPREIPDARLRQFRRVAGRRRRARDRQSLRRRPDRHPRHHFGAGADASRHHRLSVLHPDRCGDQSRQFRRRAGRHDRQARRHQHRDLLAFRRLAGHRLCDPRQYGARRGGLGQEAAARP